MHRPVLSGLLAALLLTGCAAQPVTPADPAPSTATSSSTFPLTVTADDGPVELAAAPQRVVSLSPTATESLFAVGAGAQVVAVDSLSDYPPQAPTTTLSAYTPDVEAVLAQNPDLVVLSDDVDGVVDDLAAAGVPTLLQGAATDLRGTYDQITALGTATGHRAQADAVVADMAARIAAVPRAPRPLTYYYELDPTLYTATSSTFVGQLLGGLGLVNVADAADVDGSGYPQVSAELLVDADPDLVLLADTACCGQSAQTYAQRPGFAGSTAVRTGGVVGLDDDVASRWGPRVVDLVEQVSAAAQALPAA